jgi:hypothetical protein
MPAKSKKQQRLMGMVRAVQKGDMEAPSAKVKDMSESMKPSDVKDYAETDSKNLPEKKASADVAFVKSFLTTCRELGLDKEATAAALHTLGNILPDHRDVIIKLAAEEEKSVENSEQSETPAPVKPDSLAHLKDIIGFFVSNPNPTDAQFHSWAESLGKEPDAMEAQAYELATIAARFLNGGRSIKDGIDASKVDPQQLAMGIEVEKEHSPDELTARKIALDHLAELSDYYTRLQAIEAAAGADH